MVDEKKKKKLTLTASPKKPVNVPLYIQDRKKTSVIVEKRVPKNRNEKKFYNRNDNFKKSPSQPHSKPKIIKDIKYKPDQLSSLFTVLESTSTYFSQIQIYKNQNKNGFKVSIDGHGADECLGGYPRNILNYIFD